MSTLDTMKARIASELRRSNITSHIADAISTAIGQYDGERFWWNEGRQTTFNTVADQEFYTETDIGVRIWKIDYVTLYADGEPYKLHVECPERMERLAGDGTQTSQPRYYSFYGSQLRLYPEPDDVYTIRIGGVLGVAEPATGSEADNAWMIPAKGEYLIRQRAKYELATNVLIDPELAQTFGAAVEMELDRLKKRTAHKVQSGGWVMTPTDF